MNRIGVVGISWQHADAARLAQLTLPREGLGERLRQLAGALGTPELVYLATCNRVEVVFATNGVVPVATFRARVLAALTGAPSTPGEAERLLRAWAGEGAAEHLYLVTAGLDSAKVGETDIVGQVRAAADLSRGLGLMGPRLEVLFDGALKVAARVHLLTGVGAGHTSLAELALEAVRERRARRPGAVALVGVSPMTERCARALGAEGVPLIVANRSLERAQGLAAATGGLAMTLRAFAEAPPSVCAVVCATAAPGPVLPASTLAALRAQSAAPDGPLIVDMAVPADVDPDDARRLGLERLDMLGISALAERNRAQRLEEMAEARLLIDTGLIELRRQMCDRLLAPLITQLRARGQRASNEGVERLLSRELAGLDVAQQEAVRRFSRSLTQRLVHIPSVGLRALAFEAGPEAVEAFLRGADAELAEAMGELVDQATHLAMTQEDEL